MQIKTLQDAMHAAADFLDQPSVIVDEYGSVYVNGSLEEIAKSGLKLFVVKGDPLPSQTPTHAAE